MDTDFGDWSIALAIAAICAALEAWLSGPKPFHFLSTLVQPRWALPNRGWLIVGAAFYVIMTLAAARMIGADAEGAIPLAMIVVVMVTDGFWNYLLFRLRRIDWAFWYLVPYTALVAATTLAVLAVDPRAGAPMAIYLAFLPYDVLWTRALGRLNPQLSAARPG